ncbi:MAG: hypothetical protein FJ290_01590 [Planctomycetes bacterium]|nr:hypothetical protein [Planctomycetota bacterium]
MSHLREAELVELAAGRLEPPARSAAEAHVGGCAECRARLDAAHRAWQALGSWEVTAGHDLADAIVEVAGRQAQVPAVPAWRRAIGPVLRAAAAVVLAAGIGHVAGRWAVPSRVSLPPVADERAAAEALSLDVLALQSAAGLAETVLGLDGSAQEAQQ